MWDIAYAAVVLFGAVSLIAEATRQFAKPIDISSHDRYPILRGVELSSLSTPNEYIRGYILYCLVYLAVYSGFLISTELFELLKATAEGVKVAGAGGQISLRDEIKNPLNTQGYGKPIFISAAIIFALSSGVFATVEGWVRGFAHRLAGIPRGVYRVITQLSRLDYPAISHSYQLVLTREFGTAVGALKVGEFEQPMIDEINNALVEIDLLAPPVVGQYSRKVWPRENVRALEHLIEKQKTSVAELRDALQALASNPAMIEEFHQLVLITRNNLQALFAVLFIRNQKIVLPSENNPTAKIINALREKKSNVTMQVLVGAILGTIILAIIASTILEILYHQYKLEDAPAFFVTFQAKHDIALRNSLAFVLKFTTMFMVAATLSTIARKSLIEMGHWPAFDPRRIPFQRYLVSSIFPAVAATLAYGAVEFLENFILVYIKTGTIITSGLISDLVRDTAGFALMTLGFGLLISFFVFVISDVHERISVYRTVLIGISFSILFLIWSFLTVSITYGSNQMLPYIVKDALNFFSFSFFFFVIFSILIELSEE